MEGGGGGGLLRGEKERLRSASGSLSLASPGFRPCSLPLSRSSLIRKKRTSSTTQRETSRIVRSTVGRATHEVGRSSTVVRRRVRAEFYGNDCDGPGERDRRGRQGVRLGGRPGRRRKNRPANKRMSIAMRGDLGLRRGECYCLSARREPRRRLSLFLQSLRGAESRYCSTSYRSKTKERREKEKERGKAREVVCWRRGSRQVFGLPLSPCAKVTFLLSLIIRSPKKEIPPFAQWC